MEFTPIMRYVIAELRNQRQIDVVTQLLCYQTRDKKTWRIRWMSDDALKVPDSDVILAGSLLPANETAHLRAGMCGGI